MRFFKPWWFSDSDSEEYRKYKESLLEARFIEDKAWLKIGYDFMPEHKPGDVVVLEN